MLGGGGEEIFPIYIVNLFAFPKMFPFYPRVPHLINIERAYANSVVNNDMDRIIDIFGRRNGRDSYFFNVCYKFIDDRFICKNIFTSYVGLCQCIV